MITVTEKNASKINGFIAVLFYLVLVALEVFLIYTAADERNVTYLYLIIPLFLLLLVMLNGFIVVQPNDSCVLVFFGKYVGTVRDSGFWFVNILTTKKKVTLRIRNFNSEKLKVNDLHGNPIEIAAVIVWRVTDSARAVFDVDHYERFV